MPRLGPADPLTDLVFAWTRFVILQSEVAASKADEAEAEDHICPGDRPSHVSRTLLPVSTHLTTDDTLAGVIHIEIAAF